MKIIKIIMSAVQCLLIGGYFLFYNVQYYWSIKSTILMVINAIAK